MAALLRSSGSGSYGVVGALAFCLGLSAGVASARAPTEATVLLQAEVAVGESSEARGWFELEPLDSSRADPARVALVPGQVASLSLPSDSRWRACPRLDEHWAPCREIVVMDADRPAVERLRVWPTASVVGALRHAEDAEAARRGESAGAGRSPATFPPAVEVELSPVPGSPTAAGLPTASVECPVTETGHFGCRLPAAALELTVYPGDYVPHRSGPHRLRVDEPLDLGTLELVPGGAVEGRVVIEGAASRDLGTGQVTARPYVDSKSAVPVGERRSHEVERTVSLRTDGTFELRGLAAGSWILEARLAGLAPASAYPVSVWRGQRTELRDPLVLRPPVDLRLEIDPPVDWLDRAWKVELFRASDHSGGDEEVFTGRADPDGGVTVPDQAPGHFTVFVEDSVGHRMFAERSWLVEGTGEAARRPLCQGSCRAALDRCSEGYLEAGGQLTLVLPDP